MNIVGEVLKVAVLRGATLLLVLASLFGMLLHPDTDQQQLLASSLFFFSFYGYALRFGAPLFAQLYLADQRSFADQSREDRQQLSSFHKAHFTATSLLLIASFAGYFTPYYVVGSVLLYICAVKAEVLRYQRNYFMYFFFQAPAAHALAWLSLWDVGREFWLLSSGLLLLSFWFKFIKGTNHYPIIWRLLGRFAAFSFITLALSWLPIAIAEAVLAPDLFTTLVLYSRFVPALAFVNGALIVFATRQVIADKRSALDVGADRLDRHSLVISLVSVAGVLLLAGLMLTLAGEMLSYYFEPTIFISVCALAVVQSLYSVHFAALATLNRVDVGIYSSLFTLSLSAASVVWLSNYLENTATLSLIFYAHAGATVCGRLLLRLLLFRP